LRNERFERSANIAGSVCAALAAVAAKQAALVVTPEQIISKSIPGQIGPQRFQNVDLVQTATAVKYVELAKPAAPTATSQAATYWFNVDNQACRRGSH